MNKGKWTLNRIFAFVLALMMILTVPEVSAAAVFDADIEDAVVESTETKDEVEEEATEVETDVEITEDLVGEVENNAAKHEVSAVIEEIELGSVGTTSFASAFYTTEASTGIKNDGQTYRAWIERVNLPDYAYDFYNILIEAADGDGTDDYLVADKYFSNATGTENLLGTYNLIHVVTLNNPTQEDLDEASLAIGAAFEAFDRDLPFVFWINGVVSVVKNTKTYADGSTEVELYFVLKNHANDFDVRFEDFQSQANIETGIQQFNNACDKIIADAVELYDKAVSEMTDFEKIEYFNGWLVLNNGYCTVGDSIEDYPYTSFECLSALTGMSGSNGPVCEAYARAFMCLCMVENIPCVLVDGYAGEAHMWNAVQIDGAWYAVDVTWNDPMIPDGNGGYVTDKVSGYETDEWLLVGSETVIDGEMFKVSHLEQNTPGITGLAYLNGPELNKNAYGAIIKNITVDKAEVTYGYAQGPTATVTLIDGYDTSKLSYKWYDVDFDELTYFEVEGGNTATLPTGQTAGDYKLEVYYDSSYVGYALIEVLQKEISVTATATQKIYDGTATAGVTLTASGIITGDDVSVKYTSATFADANAGTDKTITVNGITLSGTAAANYRLASETITTTGTISQKNLADVTIELDKTSLYYNGAVQTVNVIAIDGNKTLVSGTDYTVSGNTAKDVKANEYTVTITGKGNYTGTVTATYTISYLDANVTVKYNNSTTVADWYNNAVTITAEGYTISDKLDGTYSANYLVEAEGTNSGLKLYFKNADGYITAAKDIATINIDKTAPADLTIKVKENTFKKLLDTITFGIFNIKTNEVSITATETGSGIDNYYIYVDNSGSTTVKTATQLDGVEFKEFSTLSLDADGKYVIYAYAVDNAGNKSGYVCTDGIVIDTTNPTITDVVVPTVDNGNLKDTSVTISFTGSETGEFYYVSDTEDLSSVAAGSIALTGANNKTSMVAGTNTFTVNGLNPNTKYYVAIVAKDVAGNYSAVKVVEFTTQKTLPTITANPTISGTYGQAVKDMTLTDGTASVSGTWAISTEATAVPEVGTTNKYVVIFTPTDTNAYGSVSVEVVPTVAKKAVTVTIDNATKTFGTDNPTFTYTANGLVTGEDVAVLGLALSTTATKTSDVGTYVITGTANAKNYSVTFTNGTLTITKATATNPAAIEKEYVYGLGSEGTATVDIAKGLPTDRGNTTYTVETNGSIVTEAKVVNGILTYTVSTGNLNDTATITVTATSKNYEDITITVNITLVDKLSVSSKGEVTTVGTLTYGDALSKLTFGEVTFVDSQDNAVEGTITWDTPNAKLNAGTHEVAWTFIPSNTGKYKVTTGTVSVTVAKATPEVVTPTVDAITYNPSKTLADIILPTTTDGTWSWKDTSVVPTVGNEGYVAVFTPTDTTNYNTVEKTVTVEVAKATPVVSVAPTADAIVYGDTLADSKLTGGIADTAGTWSWKDATIAPTVADSNITEYEVVFTPADTTNYNTTTVKVKLVVDKAQWPANVPADEIAADYDWDTVGKVELPEGWVWADEDADEKKLEFETEVTAIANYVGDDKDNFENLEKAIIITRNVDAPHIEGDEETMGWEAIADEMKDTTEDEVRVDMNGHCVVSGDALETLRDEDKTLVVIFVDEDGKEEYTWTIKGEDVKDGNVKSLDMEAGLFAKDATDKPAIPETLVKDVVAGAKDHKFLSLSHDGAFGFKASLTINVGATNAGKLVTLYYYNETTGKLEETENVKLEVAADGTIILAFEHASDYVLTINEKPVTPPQGGEEGGQGTTPGKPATGDGVFGNVYFYITLLLAGGLAGYVGVRKKREEQI